MWPVKFSTLSDSLFYWTRIQFYHTHIMSVDGTDLVDAGEAGGLAGAVAAVQAPVRRAVAVRPQHLQVAVRGVGPRARLAGAPVRRAPPPCGEFRVSWAAGALQTAGGARSRPAKHQLRRSA